jgi:transposase
MPDFASIDNELRNNKHVTLQLLWEEYRREHLTDHYSYSRFCHHYEAWKGRRDVTMRQDHTAGEKIFVDWAGAKIPVHDPQTGEARQASIFVAVLGASNYTYVEATMSETINDWIGAHVRMFEFFGGASALLVPDNLKAGVNKACRYEPDLNPLYQAMAEHYGCGVVPARVRKPRDKAKVEVGVQIAQRWIVAALRHHRFHSLAALNEAIAQLLTRLNERPFRKSEGTRRSWFEKLDQPALRPLPAERFATEAWKKATVNIDYHIEFERCLYSVPYHLTRQSVDVRVTSSTVEIYHRGERVASHIRLISHNQRSTHAEHQPKSHRAHNEWPPSRIIDWAQSVGPSTAQLVERILVDKPHPEMGYRACLGIIRLGDKYTKARVEAASERALLCGAISYKSVASMLKRGFDQQPVRDSETPSSAVRNHGNIRGSEYFV